MGVGTHVQLCSAAVDHFRTHSFPTSALAHISHPTSHSIPASGFSVSVERLRLVSAAAYGILAALDISITASYDLGPVLA